MELMFPANGLVRVYRAAVDSKAWETKRVALPPRPGCLSPPRAL